jgi:hypothetical protein
MKEIVGRRRGSGRARIARALETGAKTVPQVAALLDTTDGALRSAVTGMERDGQIAKVEPIGRGQRWQLTDLGRRELLAPQAQVEPGVILPGQRLLVLVDAGQGVTPGALAALAGESQSILWAARMDGNGSLLVAVDGDDPFASDRIRAGLTAAGVSTVAGRVSDTLPAAALQPRSAPAISS